MDWLDRIQILCFCLSLSFLKDLQTKQMSALCTVPSSEFCLPLELNFTSLTKQRTTKIFFFKKIFLRHKILKWHLLWYYCLSSLRDCYINQIYEVKSSGNKFWDLWEEFKCVKFFFNLSCSLSSSLYASFFQLWIKNVVNWVKDVNFWQVWSTSILKVQLFCLYTKL